MTRILIVCEGNVCRSPYVERRLRHGLAQRDVLGVEVRSAGARARIGLPMDDRTAASLRTDGVVPDGHGSQAVTEVARLPDVDLVLTMERGQRAAVLDAAPSLLRRTFTLIEFDRLASAVPARVRAETTWSDLPGRLAAVRRPGRSSCSDDVADPVHGDAAAYDAFRRAVDPVCGRLVDIVTAVQLASGLRSERHA